MHSLNYVSTIIEHSLNIFGINCTCEMWITVVLPISTSCWYALWSEERYFVKNVIVWRVREGWAGGERFRRALKIHVWINQSDEIIHEHSLNFRTLKAHGKAPSPIKPPPHAEIYFKLTKNSSLMKYLALITSGSSPGSINASATKRKESTGQTFDVNIVFTRGREYLQFAREQSKTLTWCLISVKFCKIIRQLALGCLHFLG